MIKALTKSRSPQYHRSTMFRLLIAGTLVWLLWEPVRPVRTVTADVLALTADQLRR